MIMSPPSLTSEGRYPRTTLASQTVAFSPPFLYAAGPGSAPADSGPTLSALVNSGTKAIDPPPAPTVLTSTEGARTVTSPTRVSRLTRASPS